MVEIRNKSLPMLINYFIKERNNCIFIFQLTIYWAVRLIVKSHSPRISFHEIAKLIKKSRHAWGMERGSDVTGYLMQFYTHWLIKNRFMPNNRTEPEWHLVLICKGFNRDEYIHNPCAYTNMHSEKNYWQEMKKAIFLMWYPMRKTVLVVYQHQKYV